MKKIKYEKPMILDAGPAAAIRGATCSLGSNASDGCRNGSTAIPGGCVGGNDPQSAPVCQPGLTASFNCGTGTTNTLGNCRDLGLSASGCSSGTSPNL